VICHKSCFPSPREREGGRRRFPFYRSSPPGTARHEAAIFLHQLVRPGRNERGAFSQVPTGTGPNPIGPQIEGARQGHSQMAGSGLIVLCPLQKPKGVFIEASARRFRIWRPAPAALPGRFAPAHRRSGQSLYGATGGGIIAGYPVARRQPDIFRAPLGQVTCPRGSGQSFVVRTDQAPRSNYSRRSRSLRLRADGYTLARGPTPLGAINTTMYDNSMAFHPELLRGVGHHPWPPAGQYWFHPPFPARRFLNASLTPRPIRERSA